jgi:hypothetical protein
MKLFSAVLIVVDGVDVIFFVAQTTPLKFLIRQGLLNIYSS